MDRRAKLFGDLLPSDLPDSDYPEINNLDMLTPFDREVYGVYSFDHAQWDEHIPPSIVKHSDTMLYKLRGYTPVPYRDCYNKDDTLMAYKMWVMIYWAGKFT